MRRFHFLPMPNRVLPALLSLLLATACSDASTPGGNDFYEWRLIVASPGGPGDDSLTFHWPQDRLPVRIWVEDAADLPAHVVAALSAWRRGLLTTQFDADVVTDSATADVIVRAGVGPGAQFTRARLHSALAPECSGATDLDITPDHAHLTLPVRIYIDPRSNPSAPGLAECLALTTTHEVGHALGIWRHSDDPDDLMFADPTVAAPSDRDLQTAQLAYQRTPNVTVTGP
jgi:hypothetical protein